MTRILSQSNPRDARIPRIPTSCVWRSAPLRTAEECAQYLFTSPAHNTHTHTDTHMHTLQRRKALCLSFTAWYPEIQMSQTRTRTLMRKRYGYTGSACARQPEEISLSASGLLLGFICSNSKLRLPLRFSVKKSETRDRNSGRCYLEDDDSKE